MLCVSTGSGGECGGGDKLRNKLRIVVGCCWLLSVVSCQESFPCYCENNSTLIISGQKSKIGRHIGLFSKMVRIRPVVRHQTVVALAGI